MAKKNACPHNPTGRCGECKKTHRNERERVRLQTDSAHREKERQRGRDRYEVNSEKILAQQKAAYDADPKKFIARTRQYQIDNPEKRLFSLYGMLFAEGVTLASAFVAQQGLCPACHKDLGEYGKDHCADHCHITKYFRGLMHLQCNSGMGMLGDSWVTTRGAADFLSISEQPFDTVWDYP